LPRYAESARFAVERFHHPPGGIHTDPLGIGANASNFAEIEVFNDLIAGIELSVKHLRFHVGLNSDRPADRDLHLVVV